MDNIHSQQDSGFCIKFCYFQYITQFTLSYSLVLIIKACSIVYQFSDIFFHYFQWVLDLQQFEAETFVHTCQVLCKRLAWSLKTNVLISRQSFESNAFFSLKFFFQEENYDLEARFTGKDMKMRFFFSFLIFWWEKSLSIPASNVVDSRIIEAVQEHNISWHC